MPRNPSPGRNQPEAPVCWFALLQQARVDRNQTLYDLARGHLARLGIHVSFAPASSSACLVDDRVITHIADRLIAHLQTASMGLVAMHTGGVPPAPPDPSS